ncbi:MAG: aminotransferase class I/II-fold pyridoxal phosphate-dependent enzyme, partial [Aristaeellaceae bacterium]
AALLDLDVVWLNPAPGDSYLSCTVSADALDAMLDGMDAPAAVYLTSPDYLGNTVDIAAIAEVCHRRGVLLLVDNAHGAYLRFLPESRHPIDLGADICCDSAHKTLPVLTGGAYLHLSPDAPQFCFDQARTALALFGSTSPSYLILQSLDAANLTLGDNYRESLARFIAEVNALKARLLKKGWQLQGDEPLKLTLRAKNRGYTGMELARALEEQNIVCEFADPDFLVLMLTPEVGSDGLARLEAALDALPLQPVIQDEAPVFQPAARALSIRDAALSPCETLPVERCLGRILAAATVACPPAVPILVCGERIDEHALACFRYYSIESCTVVRE